MLISILIDSRTEFYIRNNQFKKVKIYTIGKKIKVSTHHYECNLCYGYIHSCSVNLNNRYFYLIFKSLYTVAPIFTNKCSGRFTF